MAVQKYKVLVKVKEVKGQCDSGFKEGMQFVVAGPAVLLAESHRVCATALMGLYPFIKALQYGAKPKEMGFTDGKVVLQCPDPGPQVTGSPTTGCVVFELTQVDPLEKLTVDKNS
jgi:uncharacterized repeat protein (TIGR04076 family)